MTKAPHAAHTFGRKGGLPTGQAPAIEMLAPLGPITPKAGLAQSAKCPPMLGGQGPGVLRAGDRRLANRDPE